MTAIHGFSLPPVRPDSDPATLTPAPEPISLVIDSFRQLKQTAPDRVLAALVEVAPAGAADYLRGHEKVLRQTLPPKRLGTLLERLLSDPHLPHDRTHTVVDAFGDLISLETIVALHASGVDLSVGPALRSRLSSLLHHHPDNPLLLSVAVEIALQTEAFADADRLLTMLGRSDPTAATVRRVQKLRKRLPIPPAQEVRIALLSSFTADLLSAYVDLECHDLGLNPSIFTAAYNTWEQLTFGADSRLVESDPEIVFIAVALDDLIPGLDREIPPIELDALGRAAVDRISGAVERIRARSGAAIVVHSLYTDEPSPHGGLSGYTPGDRGVWIHELNHSLAEFLRTIPGAYLMDMTECLLRRRGGRVDVPNLRHLARMRLSDSATAAVAAAYSAFIAPVKGLTRKCIVLDLDNTLWGGVVGEDGPHGIRLGTTAPGSEFVEFQRYLQSLSDRGFLLAIASKNNETDAMAVIREHDSMLLREDAFAAIRINWEPKPDNLASIAAELGLGLDALVFLDDNPHERALMRQTLPQVLTPELPRDPALYRDVVAGLPQLNQLTVTREDRERVERYRAIRKREQVRVSTDRLEDYLLSLDLTAISERVREPTLLRVHQLFQRTNQFNTTTRRYTVEEVRSFAESPHCRVYSLSARDIYGEHGIVAATVVRAGTEEWEVDGFVVSCRVIGLGLETALLARVAADARASLSSGLAANFLQTAKNRPAADFYERNGFDRMEYDTAASRWRLDFSRVSIFSPAWIRVHHEA